MCGACGTGVSRNSWEDGLVNGAAGRRACARILTEYLSTKRVRVEANPFGRGYLIRRPTDPVQLAVNLSAAVELGAEALTIDDYSTSPRSYRQRQSPATHDYRGSLNLTCVAVWLALISRELVSEHIITISAGESRVSVSVGGGAPRQPFVASGPGTPDAKTSSISVQGAYGGLIASSFGRTIVDGLDPGTPLISLRIGEFCPADLLLRSARNTL